MEKQLWHCQTVNVRTTEHLPHWLFSLWAQLTQLGCLQLAEGDPAWGFQRLAAGGKPLWKQRDADHSHSYSQPTVCNHPCSDYLKMNGHRHRLHRQELTSKSSPRKGTGRAKRSLWDNTGRKHRTTLNFRQEEQLLLLHMAYIVFLHQQNDFNGKLNRPQKGANDNN